MSFNRLSHENMVKLNTKRLLSHYKTERQKHYNKFFEHGELIFTLRGDPCWGLTEDDYNDTKDYLSIVKKELDKREDVE